MQTVLQKSVQRWIRVWSGKMVSSESELQILRLKWKVPEHSSEIKTVRVTFQHRRLNRWKMMAYVHSMLVAIKCEVAENDTRVKHVILSTHNEWITLKYQNYRIITLFLYVSKVRLYITWYRLKLVIQWQILQEQAGFVPGIGNHQRIPSVSKLNRNQ